MNTGWLWHEIYGWHDTGTHAGSAAGRGVQPYHHFDSAETKTRFASLVEVSGITAQLTRLNAKQATEEDLRRIHTQSHISSMKEQSENLRGGDAGDGFSPFGPGGYEIALWAAGGTIGAIEAVVTGVVDNAYALVRPPGHHATPDSGMGFCMFSNIAIGIGHAREHLGVKRIAVVDWDVHHGNGTEACFISDPDILTISLHQDGNFPPESGKLTDRGTGSGFGATINVPLPPGSGEGAYQYAFSEVVIPALEHFAPELIIVASGFDAAAPDPLGRMMLTSESYAWMTRALMEVSDKVCGGRLVINHEGGYSPVYVPYCGLAVLEALSGIKSDIDDPFCAEWSAWPGQELAPHEASVIDEAARFIKGVPGPIADEA